MLLKSITLSEFRQFKGTQTINFATDEIKNVTVIMGVNGSGKTTLAQAFTWCLYGKTDFSDDYLLCKSTLQEMEPNSSKKVRVELTLNHSGVDYTITREQDYFIDSIGKPKRPSPQILKIKYKKGDGQQEFASELESDLKIREILPKELSKYFFFDGERIGNMSKEIQSGKSEEFAEAVKNLLGLKSYVAALSHLKGVKAGKRTVIGSYNEQYSSNSDMRIREYSNKIDGLSQELDSLNSRKEELEKRIPMIEDQCTELSIKIEKNKDSRSLAASKKYLEDDIKKYDSKVKNSTQQALLALNRHYKNYFSNKMIVDALNLLKDSDSMDKGIPYIHKNTIDFLIKRGYCICGNKICINNDEHKALVNLLDYIPPKSLGNMIEDFVKESKLRTDNYSNLFEKIQEISTEKREAENKISSAMLQVEEIENQLSNLENVGQFQQKLSEYKYKLKNDRSELINIERAAGSIETDITRLETERTKLGLQNENNRKIELYKAYAEKIYEVLKNDYKEQEMKVRENLESNINSIFKNIYNGGLSLEIDEKYNIKTIVNDFKSFNIGVETSTAQSISIIFAFIAGVIKVARENNVNDEMLSTEPYPLVMDAPLSAFDKERIQTVCETLPNIAEQVIIFIKDTDGEIAEKYLNNKIGQRLMFNKINEFETYLVER